MKLVHDSQCCKWWMDDAGRHIRFDIWRDDAGRVQGGYCAWRSCGPVLFWFETLKDALAAITKGTN